MEFTPEDRKMIESLRRKQRASQLVWPKWLALLFGVSMLASAGFFLALSAQSRAVFKPSSPPDAAFDSLNINYVEQMNYSSAIDFSMGVCQLLVGVYMLGVVFSHWRKNPTEVLLLKLIEQHEKDVQVK